MIRQLETRGLVQREAAATKPVSVAYEVTEFGRTAFGFLDEPRKWSERLPDGTARGPD